jgi:hypothetical protein
MFWTFRDLLNVKRIQYFCHVIFFGEIEEHVKKSIGNATRWKRGSTMWAKSLAAWWGPLFPSWVWLLLNSAPWTHLDLKPTIYTPLWCLHDGWYVSNVSIIFDAPCLFIHHLLCVLLHFVALLCIFRN